MAVVSKEKILEFLGANKDKAFTAKEIGEDLIRNNPVEFQEKAEKLKQRPQAKDAEQQVAAEVSARCITISQENQDFEILVEKPKKYVLRTSSTTDIHEDNQMESESEFDLYPVLASYLLDALKIYSKRIDDRRSGTREKNRDKWLHPDLVGMENLTSGWSHEIVKVAASYPDRKALLWSFEVKLSLVGSNVRESYFQAVSNSSWANVGYLAAKNIALGAKNEIETLNSLYGIGLLRINTENHMESEVLIPARQRLEVHWETCDRLARLNPDFREYIEQVSVFQQTGNTQALELTSKTFQES